MSEFIYGLWIKKNGDATFFAQPEPPDLTFPPSHGPELDCKLPIRIKDWGNLDEYWLKRGDDGKLTLEKIEYETA